MNMNCIIVDDEPVSRQMVKSFISRTEGLELEMEFDQAYPAFNRLKKGGVDLVFLDVEMPEMSGLELVESLEEIPQIIMVTGNAEYAAKAFDFGLTDYLMKPVEYPRFLKAVEKARQNLTKHVLETQGGQDIYVKADGKIVRVKLEEILYVEALSDYVIIHLRDRRLVVHSTMKGIDRKLPDSIFVRVHRSFIVNITKIETIEDTAIVMPGNKSIPIGASFKNDFLSKLNFL